MHALHVNLSPIEQRFCAPTPSGTISDLRGGGAKVLENPEHQVKKSSCAAAMQHLHDVTASAG
jgi:hypothetical protein